MDARNFGVTMRLAISAFGRVLVSIEVSRSPFPKAPPTPEPPHGFDRDSPGNLGRRLDVVSRELLRAQQLGRPMPSSKEIDRLVTAQCGPP